ncbi:unnamed protein product [Rotaria socialis]|uniref:Chitin-binding type-4 domain-containing protein n=1 Tax=Rotaria socialis TaxID=392032 RepID=A0A818RVY2_9BILA|nr:unnamed protein product [Rotaria socialis]CAF4727423.1 unnamed protein product [Rotaria socialis]
MIAHNIFLLFTISILCHQVSWVYSHGYFSYPTPRNAYCTNSSCTSNGTLGAQGPVWVLPANSSLLTASPTTQTTCNGTTLAYLAIQGVSYDPGFQGTVAASWPAGSSQTLRIFISQIHTTENQTMYPTDGWQIRYRDGTQPNSTFNAIPFTYVNFSTTATTGPDPAIGFQLGQTILATITVPSNATNDGIFQFFWRNNEVGPGVMWLSCVDVNITALSTNLVSSKFSIFIALLTTIGISFAV